MNSFHLYTWVWLNKQSEYWLKAPTTKGLQMDPEAAVTPYASKYIGLFAFQRKRCRWEEQSFQASESDDDKDTESNPCQSKAVWVSQQ